MAVALQGSLLDGFERVGLRSLRSARRTALTNGAWVDVLPGWLTGADTLFELLAERVPWREERRRMYDRMVDVPRLLCFYGEADPLPHPVLERARAELTAHYAAELGEPFSTAGLCYYRDGRDSVAWHGDTIGRGRTEDTMVAIVSVGAPRALLLRRRPGGDRQRGNASRGEEGQAGNGANAGRANGDGDGGGGGGGGHGTNADRAGGNGGSGRGGGGGHGTNADRAGGNGGSGRGNNGNGDLADRGSGGGVIRHALGHGDLIVMGGSCQRTWEHAIPKTGRPVGPRISIQFRPSGVR